VALGRNRMLFSVSRKIAAMEALPTNNDHTSEKKSGHLLQ
jgi:hypothetical protein